MQSAPGIPFKGKIKSSLFLFALFILISSCGGGSGGSTTPATTTTPAATTTTAAATTTPATATATEAAVFGTVDKVSVATAKPNKNAGTVKTATPLAGATVTAIKSDGTIAGSTTTATDGTYALLLPKNDTYVIKITSGNIVMKSVYTVGTADATVNVNPGTTAAVVILEQKLGTTFDSGTAFSTAVSSVDVNASVTAIAATPEFTTTATAVTAAVTSDTNPLTDTAVTSAATTAAAAVTPIYTLPPTDTAVTTPAVTTPATVSVASLVGRWMPNTFTVSGVTTTSPGYLTLEFTATTIKGGGDCPNVRSYTTSGNTISSTVTIGGTSVSCPPVGHALTATYSIVGNTLTVSGTDYSTSQPYTATFTKLSSVGTIVRYITDAPWVAYQVGNGAWTAATSTDTGTVKAYTFDVGSPTAKFGVAHVCTGTTARTRIWQFTRAEAWDRTQMCSAWQISVAGTVTGLTGGNNAVVFIGKKSWASSVSGIANGGAFSFGVPLTGIYDLVAWEYDPATGVASKVLIQRDVVIAAATSGIAFDFANGVAAVSRTITVTGATGTNNAWGNITMQTKNGTHVDYTFTPNGAAILPPASAMVAGETFWLSAGYDTSAGNMAGAGKALDATVDPGNSTTLDPSTVTALSGVTVSAGVHPTISGLSYTKSASSPAFQDFWLILGGGATARRNIEITALWLGTATTYTVPDFTGIGTWDPAWNLATGVNAFEAGADMDNEPYLSWKNGGNDTPGNTGAAAAMTANVTLKPTLYGPRVSMRRD